MGAAIGTVTTLTEEYFGSVKSIYWAWTGGTTETAIGSGTTTQYYNGKVLYFISDPGTLKAGYDITILDKTDNDVLARAGLNHGATTVVTICEGSLGAVANSQLELVVQNAGSAGTETGEIWLYIR